MLNHKRLTLAATSGLFVEALNKIAPLFLMNYAQNKLGSHAFAFAFFGISIIEFVLPFVSYGYNHYGSVHGRHLIQSDPSRFKKLISALCELRFIHALCVFGVLCVLFSVLPFYRPYFPLILALSFLLFISSLESLWVHSLMQRLPLSNLFTGISRIVSLLCIWLWVDNPTDAILFSVLILSANALINILTFVFAMKHFRLAWVPLKSLPAIFKGSSQFALVALCLGVFERLDSILVERIMGLDESAAYLGGFRICNGLLQLGGVLVASFFSESLMQSSKEGILKHCQACVQTLVLFFGPVVVGVHFVEHHVIHFILGESFPFVPGLLTALSLSTALSVLVSGIGFQILMSQNKPKEFARILMIGTAVSCLASLGFGLQWGHNGLALGMCLGKMTAFCLLLRGLQDPMGVVRVIAESFFPAALMGVVLFVFQSPEFYVEVLIGIASFSIFFGITHRSLLQKFISAIFK